MIIGTHAAVTGYDCCRLHDRQPRTSVWTCEEKRRRLPIHAFDRRVARFDIAAAQKAAELMAARKPKGQPGELRDTKIAGIALAHFADLSVRVVNPWLD